MKKLFIFLLVISIGGSVTAQKLYSTLSFEIPFSFASIDAYDSKDGRMMRFAPWANFQVAGNFDTGNTFGLYLGLSIKNIGFSYKIENPNAIDQSFNGSVIKKKFRTYNVGIPLGLKLGSFDKFYFYGGYELEFPLHYKEKTFYANTKTINKEWLSDKTPDLSHSFFFGVEFPYSLNLKFKWYITNFFNTDYDELIPNLPTIKYSEFGSNVFYISLGINIFQNFDFYCKRYIESADGYYY
ncbi:MAG: hypothetical protein PHR20_04500 [Bacteroidales bacterium]|nr:hypothetical protein [Bacteroidales bacterium]